LVVSGLELVYVSAAASISGVLQDVLEKQYSSEFSAACGQEGQDRANIGNSVEKLGKSIVNS
jgi:hypothetical protein